MTTLLVILTIVEILIVVGVLAVYLSAISRSLQRTAQSLAKVTFGVRAIETQTSSIGPAVLKINDQLATIEGALSELGDKAESLSR